MKRPRFFEKCIIGAMLALGLAVLGGCGALRLAYNRADDAVYWWLDAYVDFDPQQTAQVRKALDDYHRWHRQHELPAYADLLARIRAALPMPTDADRVCGWIGEIEARRDTLLQRAVPALAELAATISPKQIEHLERRFAKGNDEYRDDFMQADAAQRQRVALKRWLNRAETLYGDLRDAQRERLAALVAESPFDAERQLAERIARQGDIVRVLRELRPVRGPAERGASEAAVRALIGRIVRTPSADFRAYQQQVTRHNCKLIAELHNGSSDVQRAKAAERLLGWEGDLRSVMTVH